ncbi:MAG: HNH endonuclease signature motif containing protein [bacterium]
MGKLKLKHSEVLRYQKGRRQATVRRHYIAWRNEQTPSIPLRCDNPKCTFYSNPLTWNGAELKLILDHKDGVCGNNRIENLQFLCPNCNSQQSTHGGGNKGRVEQSEGGYAIKREDGKKDYTLPAEAGFYSINTE